MEGGDDYLSLVGLLPVNPGWKKFSVDQPMQQTEQKSPCFCDAAHQKASLRARGKVLFEKPCSEYLLSTYCMPSHVCPVKPRSPAWQADALTSEPPGKW